jgi:oligoribonuclease (3'-5' exoribonuclease)
MQLKPRTAYVIFDLETTGLDPVLDQILEIGAIAVDDNLRTLDVFRRVVGITDAGEARIAACDFVRDMHTENGLLEECRQPGAPAEALASLAFASWLSELGFLPADVAGKEELAQVAGNSVDFDRTFAKHRLPHAARYFSHRYFEISGTARFAERCGLLRLDADLPHRALADCEAELAEMRYLDARIRAGVAAVARLQEG